MTDNEIRQSPTHFYNISVVVIEGERRVTNSLNYHDDDYDKAVLAQPGRNGKRITTFK